ncbi:MAG: hypothetical protein C4343_00055 [Chloroflexota bacterium]
MIAGGVANDEPMPRHSEGRQPMPFPLGRLRGLATCTSSRGVFGVLAIDHRQNLRRDLATHPSATIAHEDLVDFKRAVVRALARLSTGVLLDPEAGAAQCIADGSLPGSTGLIVALEATGYSGPPTMRASELLAGWSVAKAKRMGASAVKLLVYYHPEAANAAAQERLVAQVAESCQEHDIPLMLEPLSFSLDAAAPLTGPERRRVVIATAERLTKIGGDVLKAEFPYDAQVRDERLWEAACEELTAASRAPWVLLSAGIGQSLFETQLEIACRAGASGVVVGRAVWGDATKLVGEARAAFLADTAAQRMTRLVNIVERFGRPWRLVPTAVASPVPGEGWYLDY